MNDYKRLLVLSLAIENCLDLKLTKGKNYHLRNIKTWVDKRITEIEDKEAVVKRLEGKGK